VYIATDALPELFSQAGRDYEATGYEQCWYPLAKSEDIRSGEITGQDFLDGRVVMLPRFHGYGTGDDRLLSAHGV